jgi:hypothetical protein
MPLVDLTFWHPTNYLFINGEALGSGNCGYLILGELDHNDDG